MKVAMVNVKSLGAALLAMMVVATAGLVLPGSANAAQKQISEQVVKYIMDHTWDIMPSQITLEGSKPSEKKVIKVDKKKRKVGVKEKEAREIIMVARRSALAENCGLKKLREKNYKTLMAIKQRDKSKSLLDIVYINQMHLFTVYLWRGQVVAKDKKAKKDQKAKKYACKPGQKKAVKEAIEAYLKAHPLKSGKKNAAKKSK